MLHYSSSRLFASLVLALATLSYRFFESPLLRFGHRFQYLPEPRRDATLQTLPNEV